ncbi:MAG: Lrp/AsnC family transcriptional regulator [Anaerolineae bacterium]
MANLDALDQALIRYLNQNARMSSARIARELNVAERTIRHRIARLIERDIIRPVAVVNPSAFGYDLAVDIFCDLDGVEHTQVIEAIATMPEVAYVAYSTGDQDISIQALFKNTDDLHHFLTQKLHHIPGIRRTRTVLVPRVVKDTYQWLPPDDAFGPTRHDTGR